MSRGSTLLILRRGFACSLFAATLYRLGGSCIGCLVSARCEIGIDVLFDLLVLLTVDYVNSMCGDCAVIA